MRRRLAVLALAITSLVVIAFIAPLMLLVRRQAVERAQINAERQAQTVAGLVALAAAGSDQLSRDGLANALGNLPDGVGVVLPDGGTVGDVPSESDVLESTRAGHPAADNTASGNFEVGIPVLTRSGVVAVIALASSEELGQGVTTAWAVLGGLGVLVILAAVALATRLGRELVRPVDELAAVAHRLAEGDLAARANGSGPTEIREVATALNGLAERLGDLINAERESLADLSHRLRTPLTSLRLQAERLSAEQDRQSLGSAVDRMQEAVDGMIVAVRAGASAASRESAAIARNADLASVVNRRLDFWRVLASEQGREIRTAIDAGPFLVHASEDELGSMFDGLVGNVFAHTPGATAFEVRVALTTDRVVLTVGDAGPGFAPGFDPTRRGVSGIGSTGLGLDIARRLAEKNEGRLRIGRSPLGGAKVVVTFRSGKW